jgi:hypothetical protein
LAFRHHYPCLSSTQFVEKARPGPSADGFGSFSFAEKEKEHPLPFITPLYLASLVVIASPASPIIKFNQLVSSKETLSPYRIKLLFFLYFSHT